MARVARVLLLLSIAAVPSSSIAQRSTGCVARRGQHDGMGAFGWRRLYDANGALLGGEFSITYSGRGSERVTYDEQGRVRAVVSRHDDAGQSCYDSDVRTEAYYDGAGRLVRVTTHDTSEHPPRRETRYGYDALGRLVSMHRRDDDTVDTQFSYENGRLARSQGVIHNSFGYTVTTRATFTWVDGLLREHRDEWSSQGRTEVLLSRFEYDAARRIIAVHPSSIGGHAIVLDYDARGRVRRVARSRGSDPRAVTLFYDARDRVVRIEREDSGIAGGYHYSSSCRPIPVPEVPALDALAHLGLVPCIPTQTGGCVAPDGRRVRP